MKLIHKDFGEHEMYLLAKDRELRIIELMDDEGMSEEEAISEVESMSKKELTKEEPELFVSATGDVFEELFTPAPSFSFLNVSDEVHDPGDTLDKYSDTFKENIKLLRGEEDVDKLSKKGQVAYQNRHRMTAKEWNFWSVEYRLKKNMLMVITKAGETAADKLRKTLTQMSEEGVRRYGRELHKLCDRDNAKGVSALQNTGLNSVEINNLWTVWREFSGQRSENEGIDFIIE